MRKLTQTKLFKTFKMGNTFIESGSSEGGGIQCALDAGFDTIYSIEIIQERYNICLDKFCNNEKVFLYNGDSLLKLPKILENLQTPVTFWLDGHMSGISRNCPTLEEINIISNHPNLIGSTFIIDDVADFGTHYHEFITVHDLENSILKFSDKYKFSYNNCCLKGSSIMIAQV